MADEKRIQITSDYIILCEGKDVTNFLYYYLRSDALKEDGRFHSIEALNFGGINELSVFLRNLKNMEHFDTVKRIMILRDAETNVQQAIDMVRGALRRADLPVPRTCNQWSEERQGLRSSFTLLPTCSDHPTTGTLEDLCWEILKEQENNGLRGEVQQFVGHVKNVYQTIVAHEHKSKLHTFFSVNEDFISLKIGEAARVGAFDWNHEKLKSLRELIAGGFSM